MDERKEKINNLITTITIASIGFIFLLGMAAIVVSLAIYTSTIQVCYSPVLVNTSIPLPLCFDITDTSRQVLFNGNNFLFSPTTLPSITLNFFLTINVSNLFSPSNCQSQNLQQSGCPSNQILNATFSVSNLFYFFPFLITGNGYASAYLGITQPYPCQGNAILTNMTAIYLSTLLVAPSSFCLANSSSIQTILITGSGFYFGLNPISYPNVSIGNIQFIPQIYYPQTYCNYTLTGDQVCSKMSITVPYPLINPMFTQPLLLNVKSQLAGPTCQSTYYLPIYISTTPTITSVFNSTICLNGPSTQNLNITGSSFSSTISIYAQNTTATIFATIVSNTASNILATFSMFSFIQGSYYLLADNGGGCSAFTTIMTILC